MVKFTIKPLSKNDSKLFVVLGIVVIVQEIF